MPAPALLLAPAALAAIDAAASAALAVLGVGSAAYIGKEISKASSREEFQNFAAERKKVPASPADICIPCMKNKIASMADMQDSMAMSEKVADWDTSDETTEIDPYIQEMMKNEKKIKELEKEVTDKKEEIERDKEDVEHKREWRNDAGVRAGDYKGSEEIAELDEKIEKAEKELSELEERNKKKIERLKKRNEDLEVLRKKEYQRELAKKQEELKKQKEQEKAVQKQKEQADKAAREKAEIQKKVNEATKKALEEEEKNFVKNNPDYQRMPDWLKQQREQTLRKEIETKIKDEAEKTLIGD